MESLSSAVFWVYWLQGLRSVGSGGRLIEFDFESSREKNYERLFIKDRCDCKNCTERRRLIRDSVDSPGGILGVVEF